MYPVLGDFPTGAVIFFPFHTFDGAGASVTLTGLAVTDIEVYKGVSMTQRSSDSGYALVDTDGVDLDGITGIHGFTIDTSDNTDAGFYAAGNEYTVIVSMVTINDQTVNFVVGRFSIERAGGILALAKGANGFSAIKADTAAILVDTGTTLDGAITSILADTNELQTDWANGGRLDNILDARASQASVNTIGTNVNTIDGIVDTILIDTNELQTDWANGGRLDNILDARASQSSIDTIDGIVDSILVDTAEIGTAGAGLTNLPWNASWDAEVQSEVQDAIVVNHLDHLLAADYDPAAKPGVATALLNELVESDAGVSRFTTNALEQAPTGGGAGDGSGLTAIPWNPAWDTEVQSEAADALVAFGAATAAGVSAVETDTQDIQARLPAALVSGKIDASVGALSAGIITSTVFADDAITAAKIAANAITAVKIASDAITSAKIAAGAITAAKFAANAVDAAALAADAVAEIQSGLATAAALNTIDDFVDTEVAAIKAVTDKLDTALELDGAVYRLTTNALEQAPTGGGAGDGSGLTAIPWNPAWDAEVQSEAADALNAYDPPTNAEMVARTLPTAEYATAAALVAIDAKIDTIDNVVDAILVDTGTDITTIVTAIQAKTDQLAFTLPNQVDANALSHNSHPVAGGGVEPWRRG
jgi:phage baseplate assembly protein W